MKTPEEILNGVILTDLPMGTITEEMSASIVKAMRIYAQKVAKNNFIQSDVSGQFSHDDMVEFANYMITHDQMAKKEHIEQWLNLR